MAYNMHITLDHCANTITGRFWGSCKKAHSALSFELSGRASVCVVSELTRARHSGHDADAGGALRWRDMHWRQYVCPHWNIVVHARS
jgi:hypothetical protein